MVSLRLVSMILLVGACGGAGVRYQALGQGRVVWLAAGVVLGALATLWARPRADELPTARARR